MRTNIVYACPQCGNLPTVVNNGTKMAIQCKNKSQKPHLKIEIEANRFANMEDFLVATWNMAVAPHAMN